MVKKLLIQHFPFEPRKSRPMDYKISATFLFMIAMVSP